MISLRAVVICALALMIGLLTAPRGWPGTGTGTAKDGSASVTAADLAWHAAESDQL